MTLVLNEKRRNAGKAGLLAFNGSLRERNGHCRNRFLLCRAARELELFLDRLVETGRLPGPAEQETVSAMLVALTQAAVER